MISGPSLTRLLAPRSVAVVGANDRPGSYAAHTLANLRRAGFTGPVHGVNPARREVLGYPCVPSLRDLPAAVDAVVVATPAHTVAGVLDDAARMGCGGAVVYAAGFAEIGQLTAQQAAMAPALAHGLPVLGPNCNGLVAAASRAPLWGDAVALPETAGPVALVTQSGNLGVVALAHRGGLGLHTVVSVGNAAVVDSPGVVAALTADPGVRAVAVYAEGDGSGIEWATAFAACAERDVRLAVLKVGRTAAGRAAGAAHTAALAGDHRVFAALVAEAGGVLVRDVHELIETARALATARRHRGGIAVLTCSGGDAAVAADIAGDVGARLATWDPATVTAVAAQLPAGVVVANPLDHTNAVWADTTAIATITATVARDADVGHLLYVQDVPPGLDADGTAEWAATRQGAVDGAEVAGMVAMTAATCPGQEPPGAVSGLRPVLAALAALQQEPPAAVRLLDVAAAARRVHDGLPTGPAHAQLGRAGAPSLAEHQAKLWLAGLGVDVPAGGTVHDADQAADLAERLGFPVAVKVSAPGLVHKSDIGAVVLGLVDRTAVLAAARRLLALPGLPEGSTLLVERMAGAGVDVLVAVRTDAVVPVLVLGSGGVWAEALDDVVVVPLPVDAPRVLAALRRLRGVPQLLGGRGAPPLAVDALAALATRVGAAALAQGVRLVELNPVRVTRTGAIALDAVVVGAVPGVDRHDTPDLS